MMQGESTHSRTRHIVSLGALAVAAAMTLLDGGRTAQAQSGAILTGTSPLMAAAPFGGHRSQGYLGIDLRDVSEDQVTVLKLKDVHGVEIVGVDHDGPACKSGLRVHDVILQMNGQSVEGEEQLRRMLRETPA